MPQAKYFYSQRAVHREIAFLEWTAAGKGVRVSDGANSFLIRNDHIQVMTIHYTIEPDETG